MNEYTATTNALRIVQAIKEQTCILTGESVGASLVSDNNTSLIPLTSGSTFTGVGDYNEYTDVMVSAQTDVDGVLYFDFSVDGTNWTTFPVQGFNVTAGSMKYIQQ